VLHCLLSALQTAVTPTDCYYDAVSFVNAWMEYEVEGSRASGRPKRTWREVVEKDCQVCKLNKKDAVDHSR